MSEGQFILPEWNFNGMWATWWITWSILTYLMWFWPCIVV